MRRRGLVVGLAACGGSFAFLTGLVFPLGLLGSSAGGDEERRLLELQVGIGVMVVNLVFGGLLVYHAASALGGAPSGVARLAVPWPLLALFPVFVLIGQWQVWHPGTFPWVFPFVNLAMVSLPSLFVAGIAVARYERGHPLAWPVTWRELAAGIIYGAVGATTIAGILNTLYIVAAGFALVELVGEPGGGLLHELESVPRGWGILFDLSALSFFAPLNEEFFKGFLVALFFYRRGGIARCFLWGVLAGAGFNIAETFLNSLSLLQEQAVADRTIGGQWWAFAVARAGTATVHSAATGFAALGFFGLLRARWRYVPFFFVGAGIHAAWNFLAYVNYGDVFLAGSAPDAPWLDVLSLVAMVALGAACLALVAGLARNLRDHDPAAIYVVLGMTPAVAAELTATVPLQPPAGTGAALAPAEG